MKSGIIPLILVLAILAVGAFFVMEIVLESVSKKAAIDEIVDSGIREIDQEKKLIIDEFDEEFYEELIAISEGILLVTTDRVFTTAVTISDDGFVILPYHLVRGTMDVYAYKADSSSKMGPKAHLELFFFDSKMDIALMKIMEDWEHVAIPLRMSRIGLKETFIAIDNNLNRMHRYSLITSTGESSINDFMYTSFEGEESIRLGAAILDTDLRLAGIRFDKVINGRLEELFISAGEIDKFLNITVVREILRGDD